TPIHETELWSSLFDPILVALFSDPDRDTFLRCANELNRIQPDAMICSINQLSWDRTIGYGEVKVAEPTPNSAALASDLLRLATMTSKAIGGSETRSILTFQIHGYNLKVYITQKMPKSLFYTMTEVAEIEFPKSIQDIDSFIKRKNIEALISVYKIFWGVCCETKKDEAENEPESPALDISTIKCINEGSKDRSRECPFKY
ncbi:hypothetical protein BD770DRAFT_332511, partial [Pilaira anomala]